MKSTKGLELLESLQFIDFNESSIIGNWESNSKRVLANLNILQKWYKLNTAELYIQILDQLKCKDTIVHCLEELTNSTIIVGSTNQEGEAEHTINLYSLYMLKLLVDILIINNNYGNYYGKDASELISEKHKTLLISCVQEASHWGLQQCLHESFYTGNSGIFMRFLFEDGELDAKRKKLLFWIEGFASFIFIRPLHIRNALEQPMIHFIAAIVTAEVFNANEEYSTKSNNLTHHLNAYLQRIWLNLSKINFFRDLILLKSNMYLPESGQKMLHRQLLLRLWSPGGFISLLSTIMKFDEEKNTARIEELEREQKAFIFPSSLDKKEILMKIVVQPTYSLKAKQSLMKQILQFLPNCLNSHVWNEDYMGIALLCLRKYFDLSKDCRQFVEQWLLTELNLLINPRDTDLIVMEWCTFLKLINLLFHIFTLSSIECLPTDLLVPYLNFFLELSNKILEQSTQHEVLIKQLHRLIVKCLHNRNSKELENIIENWIWNKCPKNWHRLHNDIQFTRNPLCAEELRITMKSKMAEFTSRPESIGDNEIFLKEQHPLSAIVAILKDSNFNLLTFKSFKILFRLMPRIINGNSRNEKNIITSGGASNKDLLQNTNEIHLVVFEEIREHFQGRLQAFRALESLIQFEPMKPFINENISDFLIVLKEILDIFQMDRADESIEETRSSMLLLTIIIIREIIENSTLEMGDNISKSLLQPLQAIHAKLTDTNLKNQIQFILQILQTDYRQRYLNFYRSERNCFEEARSLIESKEPYKQVEGLECLIKLIRNQDSYTLNNCHIIMALAFETLKSPDSYTFLNCIRLFVALVRVHETDVLEMLKDEYVNETAAIDYRLLIGEVILKIGRELGPLCFKYKGILLNSFMCGCRSPLDEIRCSAFSNLAQLCRLLTFQVHNYFYELLHIIDCEVATGIYLPAKRAAVLILSELLEGMDNILHYEAMLLPIYRFLKNIINLSQDLFEDEKMVIHASNGLKCLSEKCVQLIDNLMRQKKKELQKEIKILGIKSENSIKVLAMRTESSSSKSNPRIIEMD